MNDLQSWGRYPRTQSQVYTFRSSEQLRTILREHTPLIAHGNGRSYGDSCLAPSLIHVKPYNYFLDFDEAAGIVHCRAGVLLSEIIEVFLERGWFLSVTPGTKFITVGGAIASDVHGKNHHLSGSFSSSVLELTLMTANGEIIICSPEQNRELFMATCGGMGLTGIILSARIALSPVKSAMINQVTIKTRDLKDTFDAFERCRESTYSVAWIDCLARGAERGRCLLMLGEHAEDHNLHSKEKGRLSVPMDMPSWTLNSFTVRAFNALYYGRIRKRESRQLVTIDQFFYPLDAIDNWNRIYGRSGFTQYQFVLPLKSSYDGLSEILGEIADSGKGSFLAVLKLFGKGNSNPLSFPMEGYSLALDFKIEPGLFELFAKLDEIVLRHNGRLYLAKDARVTRAVFEPGYPEIDTFRKLRTDYNMKDSFQSLQSLRVGI